MGLEQERLVSLIDFVAGLPLGTIIVDAYERLTLAEAQFRQADLTNRSQGTKFKINNVFSADEDGSLPDGPSMLSKCIHL
ncbi:MAG: hypothetical protein EOO39_05500 [Cytophagaceae bacterium]|nr:MAG: hypothetical protein EOO39_05500 [Cytophagaceae bacterium]